MPVEGIFIATPKFERNIMDNNEKDNKKPQPLPRVRKPGRQQRTPKKTAVSPAPAAEVKTDLKNESNATQNSKPAAVSGVAAADSGGGGGTPVAKQPVRQGRGGRPQKPRTAPQGSASKGNAVNPMKGAAQKNVSVVQSPAAQSITKSAEPASDKKIRTGLTFSTPSIGRSKGRRDAGKLRIIPLGGLNEIGKNMTVIEYGDDIIVIDCGLGFPDEDMLGIDLVIPDINYLSDNRDRVRGILLTHGHEDHIGALPYVLRTLNVPVYGTKLTLGILRNKLKEHTLPWVANLNVVSAGDTVKLGCFSAEFIRVNHSIADACCIAISTPRGMVIHSGDFKIDTTPYEGEMINLTRLGELGNRGVLLLMCESTNAERPGYTPSERKVGRSLDYIFSVNVDKRIVIATFSSNVHRVNQIIDVSIRHGRKVAVTGRSMLNIVSAAIELGYLKVPAGVIIDINEIKRYNPEQLTLITTGSQGEPMSALYRMAYSDHNQVTLGQRDLVILSSSAIPGNEKLVGRVINELAKNGVRVMHDSSMEVHVSGHACQEELKLFQALVKPQYFMPVHGEYRHLAAHRDLALSMGMDGSNIFISEIGRVLEIDKKGARFAETVQAGKILVDGDSVGDIGSIVLRDRKHLAEDGLVVVVASIDLDDRILLSGPDIVSRGFVYVRESDELMDQARVVAQNTLIASLTGNGKIDRIALKGRVRDEVTKFLYSKTRRRPMVLPVIMYV